MNVENISDDIQAITSSIISSTIKASDDVAYSAIMKYVQDCERNGEYVYPLLLDEFKLRHILNLGLLMEANINNIPLKKSDMLDESQYIHYLKNRIHQLTEQLNNKE